jgi:hypothetical protein
LAFPAQKSLSFRFGVGYDLNMRRVFYDIFEVLGRPARWKVFGRPVGIWVAWLGLIYATRVFSAKLVALRNVAVLPRTALIEYIATWFIMIAAVVALARRRLIARMFGAMAMTLLFFHADFNSDGLGMAIAILATLGLVLNRRWYNERL